MRRLVAEAHFFLALGVVLGLVALDAAILSAEAGGTRYQLGGTELRRATRPAAYTTEVSYEYQVTSSERVL
jgi:hypothetical protein